jgi:hypothetical protein
MAEKSIQDRDSFEPEAATHQTTKNRPHFQVLVSPAGGLPEMGSVRCCSNGVPNKEVEDRVEV